MGVGIMAEANTSVPCHAMTSRSTTDVEDVKFVINFDYPACSEDYVHRIGRTGRTDKAGTAYTFFTSSNMKQAGELIGVLKEANQVVNPKLYEMAECSRGSWGGKGRSRWKSVDDRRGSGSFRDRGRSFSSRDRSDDRRGGSSRDSRQGGGNVVCSNYWSEDYGER